MQSESSPALLRQRWIRWLLLTFMSIAAAATVAVPAWLIRPFKLQTPDGLRISYELRHWSPLITLAALALALLIGISLWNRTRGWWRKACLVALFLPLVIATWFARQNHFEWMFKPLPNAAFSNLNDAGFVSEGEMVLAVNLNGDVAAYPVRQVAYHHVVQDLIGGIPAVVTY